MRELQRQIEAKGLEIFQRMRGQTPNAFSSKNVTGRLMEWAMRDEALKVQLFRFIDVLPALKSSEEVARHARDYLDREESGLPKLARWAVHHSTRAPWLAAFVARQSANQVAKTFVLARDATHAISRLREMRQSHLAFTVDILGETVVSEREADEYQARYLELIKTLSQEAKSWKAIPQIDRDDLGDIPRVNVSVKVSALYSQIRSTDPEGAIVWLSARLKPLLLAAKEEGVFINFDMESTALKDLTLALFRRLMDTEELRGYPHVGLALQAYLRSSEQDLDSLMRWLELRKCPITIRLIKGAYWDSESILARQKGWPVPVFETKAETDASFERLAQRMLERGDLVRCAFGTHNIRSIAACAAHAEALGRKQASFEFQMLHGMAEPIKQALVGMGFRVRNYCPIGEMLPGMSYLVRRLLENTSNEGFLQAAFLQHAAPQELLRDPDELVHRPATVASSLNGHQGNGNGSPKIKGNGSAQDLKGLLSFTNEPPIDFTIPERRREMAEALAEVRSQLGQKYPLVIGDASRFASAEIISINPARPQEIIGRVARAGIPEAEAALSAARNASRPWSRTDYNARAQILEKAGELLRAEKFWFAALEVFETGKNWTESDADVAEAIDFCCFYAREMRRLGESRHSVPGETGFYHYIPRGVAVVIAPWNFPLAILCGMTTAALVTGNTVIIKPSEQSCVVAAWFMDLLQRAGVPPCVANFLPGSGAEVGDYLVRHPGVDVIAFTGSRQIGLHICEAAGKTVPGQKQLKKVICEMGGKNAIIVDNDADLDEAIAGVVHSAFGYQGQKCSALSRLIVLPEQYDRLVERLIEATRSLVTGLPEDPGTVIGPVIDHSAFERIQNYIEIGRKEAKLIFRGETHFKEGYFIGPTIFGDVPPGAKIAQEEIFGPVLSVLRARDLEHALEIANDSPYALTGGFYSRSPANVRRVSVEFEVGNLYINRGITGALVGRHPFGGFKMSGGGTKAGGEDYLQHFMFPRVVTENTMRRGFEERMKAEG